MDLEQGSHDQSHDLEPQSHDQAVEEQGGEGEGKQDGPSTETSCDSTAGSHDPVAMSHDSVATSSGQEGCSASASAGVETRAPPMTETQQKIIQALEVEGHVSYYSCTCTTDTFVLVSYPSAPYAPAPIAIVFSM